MTINEINRNDSSTYVTLEDGTFFAFYNDGRVNVTVNNASHRAYRGPGKNFSSLKEALDNYKGKTREKILFAYAATVTPIEPTPKNKVSKKAIVAATDSLNYRRSSVTGGTRDEVRNQFDNGSGFHILNLAATVENLIANPSARVDSWTLEHAAESVERARAWFEHMSTTDDASEDAPRKPDPQLEGIGCKAEETPLSFNGFDAETVVKVLLENGHEVETLKTFSADRISREFDAILRRQCFAVVA